MVDLNQIQNGSDVNNNNRSSGLENLSTEKSNNFLSNNKPSNKGSSLLSSLSKFGLLGSSNSDLYLISTGKLSTGTPSDEDLLRERLILAIVFGLIPLVLI